MKKIIYILIVILSISCGNSTSDKEKELLEKEKELLQKENELLKKENESETENSNTDKSKQISETDDCSLSLEDKVAFIRDKFEKINSETNYTTKDIENESDYGWEKQTNYYKNGELRKISDEAAGDLSTVSTGYFIWNNKLIFVYYKNEYQGEITSIQEDRVYYCNEKPIKYLKNKDVVNETEMQKVGNEYYKTYLQLKNKIKYRVGKGESHP